jgi:DNA-binding transcriptional regulator PaaX
LAFTGALVIAASSPYFIRNLIRGIKNLKRYKKQKVYDTFYKLKKRGFIRIKNRGGQIYISLTKAGKKRAGWLQIDSLKIKKPREWDGKWRLVAFDISQPRLIYREALRGKLKELGFHQFQKSIWAHPYNCKDEINLIKRFFGFSDNELRFILADKIGDDTEFRKVFKI